MPHARHARQVERARARFAALVAGAGEPDLAEAALWLAAEECPGLEPAPWLARLDALAEDVGPLPARSAGLGARVDHVNAELFGRLGFRGNRHDYHDPRNSFLQEVLERRVGIPITLCVVWVEVCRRLGLPAAGVSFPGHFLARADEAGETRLVDAFEGRSVSRRECAERLDRLEAEAALGDEHLRPARTREILARMLNNLKHVHLRRGDAEAALACCDRLLLLAPDAALERRDRGLLYRSLGAVGPALDDFGRFLALAPDHESAREIRRIVAALEGERVPLH